MYQFHQKINRKEVLLGWYSTTLPRSPLIVDNSSLIHEFYAHECKAPIHLVVDTNLSIQENTNTAFTIRGYISQPMVVGETPLANMFREINVEVCLSDAEVICLNQMIRGQVSEQPFSSVNILSTISSPVEEITSATNLLTSLLDKISNYLKEVVEGKREADPEIGIMLSDILGGLQVMRPSFSSHLSLTHSLSFSLLASVSISLSFSLLVCLSLSLSLDSDRQSRRFQKLLRE
jgi:translation initiation factor 3 subunit F